MESVDELSNSRFSSGSFLCFFPSIAYADIYDKLPQQPLGLVVIKLDGSSFGIQVSGTGTIGDVKRAVESVFSYLPKDGPETVSWDHVWSQFCLCYSGQKLLSETDYISMFGIKDGDQLHFIRHASNSCISWTSETEAQGTNTDGEHFFSADTKRDTPECQTDDEAEWDNGMVFCCGLKLLTGRFHYRRIDIEERRSSSRNPQKNMHRARSKLRLSRSKYKFQGVNLKAE